MMKKRTLQYFVFAALIASSIIGWNWPWGLLFIFWAVPAYLSGSVFFIDMIDRDQDPIFYWVVLVAWVLFGVLMVLSDIPFFQSTLNY